MPYNPGFIDGYRIPMPAAIPGDDTIGDPLDYHHHSIIMNIRRRFAFVSASNIDGLSWNPVERKGSFRKDVNLNSNWQLGQELYGANSGGRGRDNDFDEGHLTSFQEVLWGGSDVSAEAGADTFFYTNCVPQHASLNRGSWRSLEQFLLKKAADPYELTLAVQTGPVLLPDDPYFINTVNGEYIQLPLAFWKVIYYKSVEGLSAVGFMMSHRELLLDDGTVTYDRETVVTKGIERPEDIFMRFPKATAYQVSLQFIEDITGLKFYNKGVRLPYQGSDSKQVIFKRIEIPVTRSFNEGPFIEEPLDYKLENLSF